MAPPRHLPPLPWLVAFEAAARHGSFGAAAKALGTSQPAISQRVAGLESALGVALFARRPRGVELTPQGAALLAGLSEGLDGIARAVEDARRPASRDLRIATDFGFAAFWLLPRLPSLRRALPEHDVRVVTAQESADVLREPADVAVVFGVGRWPGCTAELLIRETVLPVCSPDFLAGFRSLRTLDDLRAAPLLHLDAGPGSRWLDWLGWFRSFDAGASAGTAGAAPRQNRVSINNYGLVLQAALAGQGVALGWRPVIDDLLGRGQLVPALDRAATTENGYYAVHRRAEGNSRAAGRVRAWLRAQIGEGEPRG